MTNNTENNVVDAATFIWLDDAIESSVQNRDTKNLIRQVAKGRLTTFTNPDECIDHILTEITREKLFLIVSNKLGFNVVPLVYDIPEIQTIYVYCGDKKRAESWAKPYLKVSGIFTKKQTLLHQICQDMGGCNDDDKVPMTIFHLEDQQHSMQKINEESVKFMWYQKILMVLRLIAKHGNSKADMIAECRKKYPNNTSEETKIQEFERNYTPETAVRWYTSDSFVYRLLNQALRTQHIEIIFTFRFFINDLHNRIQQLYQVYLDTHSSEINHSLTVYRGQCMPMNEIELLKSNINQLISMNSFWSVTRNREVANIYAGAMDPQNIPSPLQSTIFHIEISNISKDTTAFASIQHYSCCPGEQEILFSIGAIFKIISVIEDKEKKVWHVHLLLTKQQDEVCRDFFVYMEKQIGSEPGPLSFGWFLFRMGEFDKAERYIQLLIKQLPPNDKETGNAYNLLGLICKDYKSLEKSIECYKKALTIYSQCGYQNNSQVVAIHYNLGLAYLALGDERSADEHRIEADDNLVNSTQMDNPLLIAMTESLKAKIQMVNGNYPKAFQNLEASLGRKKTRLPPNHPSIASTLKELGIVQEKMGNDNAALEYFKQALDICRKTLSPDHFDFADYHTNIGRIHYKRQEYALALEQFQTALTLMDAVRDDIVNTSTVIACINDTKKKIELI